MKTLGKAFRALLDNPEQPHLTILYFITSAKTLYLNNIYKFQGLGLDIFEWLLFNLLPGFTERVTEGGSFWGRQEHIHWNSAKTAKRIEKRGESFGLRF